jgi:hypothetical protein
MTYSFVLSHALFQIVISKYHKQEVGLFGGACDSRSGQVQDNHGFNRTFYNTQQVPSRVSLALLAVVGQERQQGSVGCDSVGKKNETK